MAPRRGGRFRHLLATAAVALTGCGAVGVPAAAVAEPAAALAEPAAAVAEPAAAVAATTTTVTPATSTTTTTPQATTVTTASATTTTTATTTTPTTTTVVELVEIDAEVTVPEGIGPFPTVVLVHGGAWVGGSPGSIRALASHLAGQGFLTVNPRYKLSDRSPGFPGAIDDISCAVRYAASHPDGDGTVAIVGHSSGAHIGAIVALTGDAYGAGCPVSGTGIPERFVGLAGPYDISRLGFLMVPFFGAGAAEAADAWAAGNPQLLVKGNIGLTSLIMYGESDGFVEPRFALDFHRALADSGMDSHLEMVPGARHLDLANPSVVGDLIVAWLER